MSRFVQIDAGLMESVGFLRLRRILAPHTQGPSDNRSLVGLLFSLWAWALRQEFDGGVLGDVDPRDIADAAAWDGDPDALVEGLIEAGFLVRDGESLRLAGWEERYGKLDRMREANRARKARSRCGHADVTRDKRDSHADVTRDKRDSHGVSRVTERDMSVTVTDVTVPDKIKIREEKELLHLNLPAVSQQAVTPLAADEYPVFPCVGPIKTWTPPADLIAEWLKCYPTLDLLSEVRMAWAWVNAKEKNRKTAKGMKTFLVGWFNRSIADQKKLAFAQQARTDGIRPSVRPSGQGPDGLTIRTSQPELDPSAFADVLRERAARCRAQAQRAEEVGNTAAAAALWEQAERLEARVDASGNDRVENASHAG